jgi:PAS domain S-box-containing protein
MPQDPQETLFQELKRYVRFGARDAELLLAFGERAAPEFPRIAQEFYDRIREHSDAHDVFSGEEQIQRLQRSLVAWLVRICGGVYDEGYAEQTAQIGRVHVRIGLPQRYMLTAMALIRVALVQIADRELAENAAPTREALLRVLDLELALMLQTYKDSFSERIREVGRLERSELGDALSRTEHRYINAVELASVLIVGLDAWGVMRLVNREAERVTGFDRDQLLGQAFLGSMLTDDSTGLREQLQQGLSGHAASQWVEGVLRTRAGKHRDLTWNLAFAGEQAGDDVVLFAIGRDLTDARALAERTRQAEKLAAIGTLAAGLAHEIRNPLNGAQLHVSFLQRAIKKKADEQDLLEATQVVADEIKRLADLVTEFLDFARPKPLQLKPVSLFKLCEHARSMVAAQAEAAGVALSCDLPSADLEFQADSAKLTQVLLNLLQNGVEATGSSGGGSVVLRARREPRHVAIEVQDDGPGLPSPDAPIFDAFFSTKEGGTGLGLAITHRIVTDHNGTITVAASPSNTTFRIKLPLVDAEHAS